MFKKMHLKASVMNGLAKLLLEKTTNLKRFGIIDNPISDAGAVCIAQALQNNTTITELDLTDCKFAKKPSWLAPKTGTTELATVLKNTLTLVSLKLAETLLNPPVLRNSLKDLRLTTLSLS